MPKTRPVLGINQAYGLTRNVTGGSGGSTAAGGGVTDHGALAGLSDDDHAQYLNNTRGDARYYLQSAIDLWRTDHEADADVHHNRQHSITSSADHTVTGSQYDIIGLTATNTIGILTPASDASGGNTILITDGSGNITVNALATDATATIGTNATVGGTLGVTGVATFDDDLTVGADVLSVDESASGVGINISGSTGAGLAVNSGGTTQHTLLIQQIENQTSQLLQVRDY